ncbi:gag/pol protein [Cucumis melo var. makuwa]|uniref:Gag/pol protein n=1 Tax=Cucumis melo var. makuwa TaxID=1194695 RepID=A0A5A7U2X3_CUCMM|nr:gag/pol protein [Cucumis melo var. makuwa]
MMSATLNMLAADKLNVEECPQVPVANATRTVREAHERWVMANEKARAYILARLFEILAKKHELMLAVHEIMDSMQEMFASVREHVPNMMVYFIVAEMNAIVIDEASQTFKSLMKTKGQKEEANVATSTRKFHRGSTSITKFMPSSSGTKKSKKKKKGGQGNKANLAVAKTNKKAKAAKEICFLCN